MCTFTTTAGVVRYLIPVYFNNILLLVISTQNLKKPGHIRLGMVCMAGLFAVLTISVWEVQIRQENRFGDESLQIAKPVAIKNLLQEKNIKYGYADFSDAYGNTMLSNGEITMVAFHGSDLSPFYWLTSEQWYREEEYDGRHCILIKDQVQIDEIYYICADEIVHYHNYVLLIFDDCIIKDLQDQKAQTATGQKIALSSLNLSDMAYRYENSVYLKTGGNQFGPYIDLKKGKYVVELTGKELHNAEPYVLADHGVECVNIEILDHDEAYVKYSFALDEDKEGVEFCLKNDSQSIIAITDLKYSKMPE